MTDMLKLINKEIIHHARLATLMLAEQMQPDAEPDAGKVARALSKLAELGKALDVEQVTDEDAAKLLQRVFRGDTRVNR